MTRTEREGLEIAVYGRVVPRKRGYKTYAHINYRMEWWFTFKPLKKRADEKQLQR